MTAIRKSWRNSSLMCHFVDLKEYICGIYTVLYILLFFDRSFNSPNPIQSNSVKTNLSSQQPQQSTEKTHTPS